MAQMTVLQIVQDILNDLEENPVNSIDDSVAAQEVAQILKTTYSNIIDSKNWSFLDGIFTLTALALTTKPNYLKIPTNTTRVDWIKYNVRTSTDTKDRFIAMQWKSPEDFLELVNARDSSEATVQVVTDYSGTTLNIKNDKAPEYFTSFDDTYLVFDSFDSDVDTTLQSSKATAWGKRTPTFTLSDSFIPDLPVQMFSYLLNETKATCFSILKQTVNAKIEQHSTSQRRRMSQDAWRLTKGIKYPNYGRKK